MEVLAFNTKWMIWNSMLAILPVLFAYFILLARSNMVKILLVIPWLVLFPNTIYIYTDLMHVIFQVPQTVWWAIPILVLQHALLQLVGLVTFILGYRPFEVWVTSSRWRQRHQTMLLILFNLLVTFGVVMGRVERVNSWELISDPLNVVMSILHVFSSFTSMGLFILLSVVTNCIYFLFRNPVQKVYKDIKVYLNKQSTHFWIDK